MNSYTLTLRQKYLLASSQFHELYAAGFTPSQLCAAGFTPSQLCAAGFTMDQLYAAGEILADVPLLEKPYTRLLAEIKSGDRKFDQSTFGPGTHVQEKHLCETPMCIAGHLVNMAGEAGWKLKEHYHSFVCAAALLHAKAHPNLPPPNFSSIPDDWALAYIEEMATIEANQT